MKIIRNLIAVALVALAAISCKSQPEPANFRVYDFDYATVFGPLSVDSLGYLVPNEVIICDSTLTGSIVVDSVGATLKLDGPNAPQPIIRNFDIQGFISAQELFLLDSETGSEVILTELYHTPSQTNVVFIETNFGVIRLSNVKLPCDEL